ncbi:MAG: glucose-6-phosphate isomerase [Hyphomicrobiaceae bacterium]
MQIEDAWNAVYIQAERLKSVHLRELFATDADRFSKLSVSIDDLTIDFSKEKLDSIALDALLSLARAADIEAKRDAMFTGETWNLTEGRAVLHMALRGGAQAPAGDAVDAVRERFLAYAEDIRSGGRFDDVINIGIGGSDLGPVMATRALAPDHDGPRIHFVSNVDGAHLTDVQRSLNPARTLVIIASKTFTTLETMTNAHSARDWLGTHAGSNMAAVSTNIAACAEFGIPEERVFGFWDWVGGRYSLWSAIGFPLAIAVGAEAFRSFLAGAAAMDRHFRKAPLKHNLPVLLALVGIWRRNAMGWPTVALIPYDQRLERFPAYVQQLDMESNGKRVTRTGGGVATATGPVIWGEPGTNAQHSFFQLIHQGTDIVPVDFVVAATPREKLGDHHALLLANCLAQSQALAFGKTEADVRHEMAAEGKDADDIDRLAPHRTFPGDRPSTTILHRQLDALTLGRLTALYEHKVFVQGAIWDVNSFDQWGVELGKQLAARLSPIIRGDEATTDLDSSTAGLIARIHNLED